MTGFKGQVFKLASKPVSLDATNTLVVLLPSTYATASETAPATVGAGEGDGSGRALVRTVVGVRQSAKGLASENKIINLMTPRTSSSTLMGCSVPPSLTLDGR